MAIVQTHMRVYMLEAARYNYFSYNVSTLYTSAYICSPLFQSDVAGAHPENWGQGKLQFLGEILTIYKYSQNIHAKLV